MTYRLTIRNRIRIIISSCLTALKTLPIRIAKRHRAQQCYRLTGALVTGVAVVACYYLLFIYTRRMSALELGLSDASDPYWTSDVCRASPECRAHARIQYLHGLLHPDQFRIPHIVHQSAYTADSVPVKISYRGQTSLVAEWMHSWADRNNPFWRYLFWSWADIQHAMHAALPQYDELLSRLTDHQMRLDLGRYAILYLVGGVFVDLDIENIAPIPDEITLQNDAFLVGEPELVAKILHGQSSRPDGALLGSRSGHPFWVRVMDAIADRVTKRTCTNRDSCTGASLIAEVFLEYKSDKDVVSLLPARLISAAISDPDRMRINEICANQRPLQLEKECEEFEQITTRTLTSPESIGVRHGFPDKIRFLTVADIIDVIPPARLERPFDNPTQWSWWRQT